MYSVLNIVTSLWAQAISAYRYLVNLLRIQMLSFDHPVSTYNYVITIFCIEFTNVIVGSDS